MSFGERLRDAMLASGIESGEALVRRCELVRPSAVTLKDVNRAIASGGETLGARQLITIGKALRVRHLWLMDGVGAVKPITGAPLEVELLVLADALTKEQLKRWLRIGRKMTW